MTSDPEELREDRKLLLKRTINYNCPGQFHHGHLDFNLALTLRDIKVDNVELLATTKNIRYKSHLIYMFCRIVKKMITI